MATGIMQRFGRAWTAFRGFDDAQRRLSPTIRNQLHKVSRDIAAKYDAAQTTDENTKHWSAADQLGPRKANSVDIRSIVSSRGRYEWENNSYCRGMIKTYANEVVGTGPRLQLQTSNEAANREIEYRFGEWMAATNFADKLRLNVETRLWGGELFNLFVDNPKLECEVTLDLKPIEGEQVTTPFPTYLDATAVDGIRFDRWGNPKEYDVLPRHPGGEGEFGFGNLLNWIPKVVKAGEIIHYFRVERAGQARGIADITAALPLFAQLRRYTLAVLMAAELAASFAAIITTNLPPGEMPLQEAAAWEVIDIVRGMMQTLPAGSTMQQFRPEQPATTYSEFVRCLLREICRCLEMPYSVATGDGSDNSYASGRLEVQSWERKCLLERSLIASRILNRTFSRWLTEATLIHDYLPLADIGPPERWRKAWFWDGFKHVDPAKEANATDTALKNLSMTLEDFYASKGMDWHEKLQQIALEFKTCEKLGIPHPSQQAAPQDAGGNAPPTDGSEADQNAQDAADNANGTPKKRGVAHAVGT